MKDLGWKLFYSPVHVLVAVAIVTAVVMWLPVIVWFFLSDTIEEMANVGP